ncbi:hypothetical protein [Polaribacter sp.]|uniref:hypothetical protein n=1 Tax=Polaribacter sp. TaxID=1920175 RepID=UPI003F6AB2FB
MLNNILNLDGVTVLDKKQQKQVNGGMNSCKIVTFTNGVRSEPQRIWNLPSDGYSQEYYAQIACGQELSGDNPVDRCFYDCSHDGFGQ